MQFDKSFTSHFVDSSTGTAITGLTGVRITILQRNDDDTYTKVVNNVLCTEIMEGWYHYVFSAIQDKFYLYAIYPNDARVQPESGFVDKRLNNLDQAVSDIRGGGGGGNYSQAVQTALSNTKTFLEKKIEEEHNKTRQVINDTNSHIDIAKGEITDKIESIEIPEAKLEEKEAKKVLKIVTDTSKTLKSYIDSEMKEKEEIGAISRELTKLEMEEQRQMLERKMQEEEDKKKEAEEKKKEEEEQKAEDARLAELLNKEFDKLEEEDKKEKKKELEKELEETLKEAEEIKQELKSL